MRIDDVIEGILSGDVTALDGSTEAAWHQVWRDRRLSDLDPEVMAALGGALADRLSWVFLAGYQATIYRCFPTLSRSPGWTSFVNTEDASGALPGTVLSGDGDARRLNGWKGWVAASDHVERLLVSAKQEQLPFVLLDRDTLGVRIESRGAPGYLPDLSQGRAEFVDVAVPDDRLLGDERTFPAFRVAEGAYVRVALHAFILGHARRLDASPALIADALAGLLAAIGVVRLDLPSRATTVAMHGIDQATQRLAEAFEPLIEVRDADLHARWMRDRRLVTGSSDRLAARAAQAIEG